ncbi:MAG: succinylglutamate desuccinylase/aspartoacylase family protein, partial [bacterium]
MSTHLRRAGWYSLWGLILGLAGAGDFWESRQEEPLFPSFGLSATRMLSHYHSGLKGTRGDSELFIYQGREPGGTVLILGGTHPNEPAGYLSAVVILENLKVQQGKVIVLPRSNNSAFTATEPQEAYPLRFQLKNAQGKIRHFRVGSRYTNALDGWPDPLIYRHYPSGQILSGPETRNLNRAYPGKPNGRLTEQIAYAIAQLIRQEKIDLVIDLHEAAPEYPVVNAIVAHERAMDVASAAAIALQMEGLEFRLEPSPYQFRGLIHRELGDITEARVILLESTGALQGRLRGPTDTDLVIYSRDPYYFQASQIGKTQVPFPEEGIPLEVR